MDVETNVGGYDRIARAIVGPVLLIVAIVGLAGLVDLGSGMVVTVALVVALIIGLIASVTAYTQECIINQTLGIDTLQE